MSESRHVDVGLGGKPYIIIGGKRIIIEVSDARITRPGGK